MFDKIDDLVLLLLRCDGKRAAIMSYQEETGASRARAVRVVERIARKHGIADTWWIAWRTGMAIVAVATIGILYFLFLLVAPL
jgi:hypothetical protein